MLHPLQGINIAILCCDGFEEQEMVKPRQFLKKKGATTHLITPHAASIKSWFKNNWHKKFKVDLTLEMANPENYDGILLPGGVLNPDQLRTNTQAIKFINHFFKKKKLIAAICHAPLTLIETKKLKNRMATSYHSIKSDLVNAGVKWKNKSVVIDHNLITSREPKDIQNFNNAILYYFTS